MWLLGVNETLRFRVQLKSHFQSEHPNTAKLCCHLLWGSITRGTNFFHERYLLQCSQACVSFLRQKVEVFCSESFYWRVVQTLAFTTFASKDTLRITAELMGMAKPILFVTFFVLTELRLSFVYISKWLTIHNIHINIGIMYACLDVGPQFPCSSHGYLLDTRHESFCCWTAISMFVAWSDLRYTRHKARNYFALLRLGESPWWCRLCTWILRWTLTTMATLNHPARCQCVCTHAWSWSPTKIEEPATFTESLIHHSYHMLTILQVQLSTLPLDRPCRHGFLISGSATRIGSLFLWIWNPYWKDTGIDFSSLEVPRTKFEAVCLL